MPLVRELRSGVKRKRQAFYATPDVPNVRTAMEMRVERRNFKNIRLCWTPLAQSPIVSNVRRIKRIKVSNSRALLKVQSLSACHSPSKHELCRCHFICHVYRYPYGQQSLRKFMGHIKGENQATTTCHGRTHHRQTIADLPLPSPWVLVRTDTAVSPDSTYEGTLSTRSRRYV